MNMRSDQVRAYVVMMDGTAEPSGEVFAELQRVVGHLRSLADACEAAVGRLEWVKS